MDVSQSDNAESAEVTMQGRLAKASDDISSRSSIVPQRLSYTQLRIEVLLVLGLSLGLSAIQATVELIGRLTSHQKFSETLAVVNSSFTPGRPGLDLAFQLISLTAGLMPALLALYLLSRSEVSTADIGLDTQRPGRDLGQGVALAALIGIPGLLLYVAAHNLGVSANIVAEDLPAVWWRVPVLVLSAAQNAILEEVVIVAYLLTRLDNLGWKSGRALVASSVLRGTYHLYQGLSGFVGNFIMGAIFGRIFQRFGRVVPLILAHTVLDVVAFVGYVALHGHVGWLP